jgi:predicted dehydrogenase
MRVAMIGTGAIAENHCRGISQNPEISLAGVYDLDHDRAVKRGREWDVPVFGSLDEIFADESIVAVEILTPSQAHVPVAIECLEAGRHVLVEKPVSTDPDEIVQLIDARDRAERVVMPAHCRAYPPEFQRLRRLVKEGRFGHVRAIFNILAVPLPEEIASLYQGVLREEFIHPMYQTVSLVGAPEKIFAGKAESAWESLEDEDQAWMMLEYPGGLHVHHFASWAVTDDASDPWTAMVKVLGTLGSGSFSWRTSVVHAPSGLLTVGYPAFEDSFGDEQRAFREAIENDKPVLSPLEDALTCARVLVAAERAAAEGVGIERGSGADALW